MEKNMQMYLSLYCCEQFDFHTVPPRKNCVSGSGAVHAHSGAYSYAVYKRRPQST